MTPTSSGGGVFFIPSTGEYVMLNDVSMLVATELQAARTLEHIVDRILGEYEVSRAVVMKDVETVVRLFIEKDAAEEVRP